MAARLGAVARRVEALRAGAGSAAVVVWLGTLAKVCLCDDEACEEWKVGSFSQVWHSCAEACTTMAQRMSTTNLCVFCRWELAAASKVWQSLPSAGWGGVQSRGGESTGLCNLSIALRVKDVLEERFGF